MNQQENNGSSTGANISFILIFIGLFMFLTGFACRKATKALTIVAIYLDSLLLVVCTFLALMAWIKLPLGKVFLELKPTFYAGFWLSLALYVLLYIKACFEFNAFKREYEAALREDEYGPAQPEQPVQPPEPKLEDLSPARHRKRHVILSRLLSQPSES